MSVIVVRLVLALILGFAWAVAALAANTESVLRRHLERDGPLSAGVSSSGQRPARDHPHREQRADRTLRRNARYASLSA